MSKKRGHRQINFGIDEYLYRKITVGAEIMGMTKSGFCRWLIENGYDLVPMTVFGKKWEYINKAYEDEVVIPEPKPRLLL